MSFFSGNKYHQLCIALLLVGLTSPLGIPFALAGQSVEQRVQWLSAELNPEGKFLIQKAISESVAQDPETTDAFLLGFIHSLRRLDVTPSLLDLPLSQPDELVLFQLKSRLFGFSAQPPPIQASLSDSGVIKYLPLSRLLAVMPPQALPKHTHLLAKVQLVEQVYLLPSAPHLETHDICPMGP